MITPEQYVGVVAERIQRGGGRLNSVQLGPAIAAVGLFTERTCQAPWIGTPPRSSSPAWWVTTSTRMVAVDMTTGYLYAFPGDRLSGTAAQASIHARLTFCFPQPPEIYAQLQWQAQQQAPPPPPGWEPQVPPQPAPPPPPYGY
ncbi:MAG: hypothetical protein JWQ81_6407 [Amycolatopsis sp.]|uniref:hypothetical protein n=1 Tax=Amycolatopsis sp. TaxID=37632 RepID=UPI00261EE8E3|nr:hypothetical protein [Amycolatopsis sp.]MCU1685668.1 hypothetical protein [Amycolatopsis sp.]